MIERSSGVLLPVFSLPSPYGIGTLGYKARKFIDFLAEAGQRWWQVLPVGPTGYGDSPYQSFSSYAGNPYFIDFDILIAENLLKKEECESCDWGENPEQIDYAAVYENRFRVLKIAAERGLTRDRDEVKKFAAEHKTWLKEYALFMALKRHFDMKPWYDWSDAEIRMHHPAAVARYKELLRDDIEFFIYIQYLFYRQWDALRKYAGQKGIGLIGDMPIYVAMDSADVWSAPQYFLLDKDNVPIEVAGVPPDAFTGDGQLWGNPLYRWDEIKKDGYSWWLQRIGGAKRLYDMLRIDHFRGFESYWAVAYGSKTAKNGRWIKGPGIEFVGLLNERFYDFPLIAEDLGYLTPEVEQLLKKSGLPGMKVLQFAFDTREPSNYLPHTYTKNCVCYIGTHDNPTLNGWLQTADSRDIEYAAEYLGLNSQEGYADGIIRGGMSSVANLFVLQAQDLLGLGAEARMNTPGTPSGNWRWRLNETDLTPDLAKKLYKRTKLYGRIPPPGKA